MGSIQGDQSSEVTAVMVVESHPVAPRPGSIADMTSLPDPAGAGDAYLRAKEQAENFPVALRILPRRHRAHLLAVYDVARVVDDLGDRGHGDRRPALREFDADLDTLFGGGTPRHPVLQRLRPTMLACGLDAKPFHDLVAANLQDQEKAAYGTFDDLVAYCRLSADPVGRIVLRVFGAGGPRLEDLSDRVCTALQIIEHCQDVAEDRRAGRIYLPLADLDRFDVRPTDLDAPRASPAVRALVAFEAERAGTLLDQGLPLLKHLRGWARLAVTGYLAGGRATLYALRRAEWDVLARTPRPSKRDILAQAVAATFGSGVMSR